MSSFVVIGESLLDEVQRGTLRTIHPGGAPLNVAVGLARLERDVTLITRIGQDDDGETIIRFLTDSAVRLYPGSIDHHPTSTAHAQLDPHGNASYTFDVRSDFPPPPTLQHALKPRLVHIGSLGAHLEPGATTLRSWLSYFGDFSTISYDPNVRLGLMGPPEKLRREIDELMPAIDVVKASIDDMAALGGPTDPHASANYFLDRGAQLVVITMGAHGLLLATATTQVYVPAVDIPVVDTVGAGDSLMSALIDGLSRMSFLGGEDGEALRDISRQGLTSLGAYAAAAAGITVARPGAQCPTREELSSSMDLYSSDLL